MACDTFCKETANQLLQGKYICIFGGSNIRAIYKDLIWLLEDGRLSSDLMLKTKNEESHANDVRLSNGTLHNGVDYQEIREYNRKCRISFQFITRLSRADFIKSVGQLQEVPNVIVINSCVWDLTRWGPTGLEQFKKNIVETLAYLHSSMIFTRIIWLTALPPAFQCYGGVIAERQARIRKTLPWHVLFANNYATNLARNLTIDVLDLHYYFRFLMNYQIKDGIHWQPVTVRFAVNLLLTHISLAWNKGLPKASLLPDKFVYESTRLMKMVKRKVRKYNRKRKWGRNRHSYPC